LKEKVVLLTGGANGIGAATVREFHRQGTRVYFCDRDGEAGEELKGELPGSDFQRLDLTREKEVLRWVQKVREREDKVHVLVNNAAIDPRIPLAEQTIEKVDELFAVNLRPFFILARACAPLMPKAESAIVNLSSITFHLGPEKMSAYVATKAGIIGFTRALARELGPAGIRVNTVSPGWVMTERQLREYVDAGTKKTIRKSQCVPELLQPADIAEVILFLASNASRAMTGQELLADRGWSYS
jgi:NAD(P)-dependent dehydrogenase (short-subunit alcohol dehydrogenase family)